MISFLKRSPGYLNFPIVITWLLFFSFSNQVKAQDESFFNHDLKSLIIQTDSLLGADDELVNGKIYIQENLLAEGHPFFLSPNWQPGNVVINGKKH
ncbi:MAG: hypothetical protein C0591_02975, partial [Marinilabiliales bacterium]